MNSSVKTGWGFIGASTIAKQWMIDAVRQQGGNDVVALMSSSAERGAAYARENGIARSYDTLEGLLADPAVDAVYISTTNELHKEQTLAAAAAGKHVLCEKPLALRLDDAIEMVEACKAAGVVIGTNHHLRNAATHEKVRDLIADGAVGEVVGMRIFHAVYLPENLQTWRLDKPDAGGGLVLDITVHDFDTIRYILGADPLNVVAQTQNKGMASGMEDGAMCVFAMPNGAIVQTHEGFTTPYAGTGLEVHGTQGSIFASGVMTQRAVGEITLVNEDGRHTVVVEPRNLYGRSVARFLGAVAGTGTPAATGGDGVKSLAAALAVLQSAAEGVRVTIDYRGY